MSKNRDAFNRRGMIKNYRMERGCTVIDESMLRRFSLNRENYNDFVLLGKIGAKVSKMRLDKFVPKFNYEGKTTSVEDEIIYLFAFRCFWELGKTSFDTFIDMHLATKDLKLNPHKAQELDSRLIKYLIKFNKLNNPLLKSPDHLFILDIVRNSYILYNMEFLREDMIRVALEAAVMYLQFDIVNNPGIVEDYELMRRYNEDEIARLCTYSIISLFLDKDNKCIYDSALEKIVKKNLAESLDKMVENDKKNRFGKMFLEYKHLCNNEHSDEEREDFWNSKKDDILSDFGSFDKESIIEFRKATKNNELQSPYLRCINDSFKNLFSDYYDSLNDVNDERDRSIIFTLIERYLYDIEEILSCESMMNIRKAIYYTLAITETENVKEQSRADLDKCKEQAKIRVNKYKKELELVKEQLNFHKNKNAKLTAELSKIDKDAVKVLNEKVEELKKLNTKLQKIQSKHELEKERLEQKIRKLENSLAGLQKQKEALEKEAEAKQAEPDIVDDEACFQSKEIPASVLYNAIKDKKILLVGGDRIHSSIIERGYNNIELIKRENVNITMHSGQKYDLVVIYTKYVGHSLVDRVESELKNSDIPIIRFNQAGVNTLLFTIFMYLYGGGNELVGEYTL